MMIKELVKRIVLGKRYSSETFTKYLRSRGVRIGEDVTFFVPSKITVDEIYPWMISIGNHVRITERCKIFSHDFAWSVPKTMGGAVLGASGRVEIGNNVFIGMDSIICRNVSIGENVIIGAGSVVTKDCQPNSVYAGNPARRISSIEDFINKRTALQNCEAVELVREYYHKYKQKPDKYAVGEYFMLFTNVDKCREFQSALDVCKNSDESIEYMRKHPAIYDSYDAFVEEALKE